ncbi:ZN891 protein, partial [Falcunculus frontatus]|nr:ZN891 protein [Falcunculus frontatus]
CSRCGKSFPESAALLRHQRGHGEEPPAHGCPRCGAAFAEGTALLSHLRGHAGDKPYTCGDCGKGFGGS